MTTPAKVDQTEDYADIASFSEVEQIQDVRYMDAVVNEWKVNGKPARLRFGSINSGDLLDFIEANEGPAKKTAGLRLLIKSIVDREGKRTGDAKHLEILKKKDSKVIIALVEGVLVLNGLDKATAAAQAKNALSEVSIGDSPSASQPN